MILTNKQEEGLRCAVSRYYARKPWTCIAGYAGTGKSTLIQFIIEALELEPEDVAYVTLTGKAASVLRQKNCPNAMTAHRLLYHAVRQKDGSFIYKPKDKLEEDYKLIIVDEISMLPVGLWHRLLSHRIPIIACGDPFQIPPINPNEDNHVLDKPHVFLDEIMRQAKESEIIRLSMGIREYKYVPLHKGPEVQIIAPKDVIPAMNHWADQIIVGTNKMRNQINQQMRLELGRGTLPEVGDKVICCRNCWDIMDWSYNNALTNGTIGYLDEFILSERQYPKLFLPSAPILDAVVKGEMAEKYSVNIDQTALMTGEKFYTPAQEFQIAAFKEYKGTEPIEFNYGYAITGHRAQGSQWNKVMVYEERFPFGKEEHARWLYTCVTRAASRLVLVKEGV
jgi:exodeoxyribonuclease-5